MVVGNLKVCGQTIVIIRMLKVLDEDCPMFFLISVKVLQYLVKNLTVYMEYVSLNSLVNIIG